MYSKDEKKQLTQMYEDLTGIVKTQNSKLFIQTILHFNFFSFT